MRVLAIDPGERCGWAHGTIERQPVRLPRNSTMDMRTLDQIIAEDGPLPLAQQTVAYEEREMLTVTGHGIAFLKDMAIKLLDVAHTYDVIVFEEYRISATKLKIHAGSDVPTLQMVGMIRLAAWTAPHVKLVTQYPKNKTTADRSMPDWLREKIDSLPAAHDDSHDGDALRHLWHYYWKHYV